MDEAVIVSACLLGIKCRYDGSDRIDGDFLKCLAGVIPVPVCPEQLGGMPTPRPRSAIGQGDGVDVLQGRAKVYDENGEDVTAGFLRGASEALKIAKMVHAKRAFLQERSPSCGVKNIVKNDEVIKGPGVFAALLAAEGVEAEGV